MQSKSNGFLALAACMYVKPTRNYNIVDIIFWFFDLNDHSGSSILMITLVHQGAAV